VHFLRTNYGKLTELWGVVVVVVSLGVIMLDTLKVYTPDFEVKDRAQVSVQPGLVEYATGQQREVSLFKDELGRDVYGQKAFVNTERYNLTIQPMGAGVELFLQTSLPKVVHEDNYTPLTNSETGQAINEIASDLKSRGVVVNLDNCGLSRVDLFKNVIGDNDFLSYSPLFELLQSKRQHKRDYGTTFTWSNTQREICVYDKLTEMQSRGVEIAGFTANTLRFEYRLKNSRVCKRELSVSTVKELVNNLDNLAVKYKDALSKSIFSLNVDDIKIIASQELQTEMRFYAGEYGDAWLSRFLRDYGSYHLARMAGDEVVKIVMACVIDDRFKLYRAIRYFEQAKQGFELSTKVDNERTLADLYGELKQKVMA